MNRTSSQSRCNLFTRTAFCQSIIRETTETVLFELIVSSVPAFEACAVNRNTGFVVPDTKAGK